MKKVLHTGIMPETHLRLRLLAAKQQKTMGEVLDKVINEAFYADSEPMTPKQKRRISKVIRRILG
jgi:hypothetical protein